MIRQLAAHTVSQLKGAAPSRTVAVLAPNMLALAQALPQNRGKLCPLVPEGEPLEYSSISIVWTACIHRQSHACQRSTYRVNSADERLVVYVIHAEPNTATFAFG